MVHPHPDRSTDGLSLLILASFVKDLPDYDFLISPIDRYL